MSTTPINPGTEREKKPSGLENFAKILGIANSVASVISPALPGAKETKGFDFGNPMGKPSLYLKGAAPSSRSGKSAALGDDLLKAGKFSFQKGE